MAAPGRKFNGLDGVSDIIGFNKRASKFLKGVFIGVEVKVGKDRLSDEQVEFLNVLRQANGVAIVATSLEEFKEEYKRLSMLK